MATETIIPESVCLKTGEREDNALSSEVLEENITQLLDNKVKQLESGPNQPLDTSSQVVETVNTQLETGIPTNESGTFFQALSIPKVAADEHINTPESCVTTTTEDQEVRTMTDIEATTEGKPNEEQVVAVLKEAFANEQQSNKRDHELVEAIPAQTQGSIVQVFGKELEQVTDVSYKDESMDGSLNTEIEAVNDEGKAPEFVKTEESIKEDTEDVTPAVEIEDQGLHEGATDDVCVSTEIKHEEETNKNEEKKEGGEESSPEKAESELSDSIVPSKKEALDTLEKDQGDSEGVTNSQDATCEDIKETIHATTMAEQDQNERPRELIKEQIEDKSINALEANELCEDEVKGEGEQKPEESVKKTEEEEEIDKIMPSVEIEEKVDQNGLLHAITTDACISTQTKSQVDTIEHEKRDEEEATQSDDGQKEKSDSPMIKEVCEDNSSEKVEHGKEQEVNMLDKDQDEVGITSTQDVAFEGGLWEKNHHSEGNTVSTKVCISTQTEPHEETTENEEKNDEDVIESDDGNTKSSGSPMIKEVCEETVSEKAESDEVLKSSDSFSMVLNENEIVSKDEDQEKEQALYVSQKSHAESQVNTTKLEEGHEEEVIESNDSQNENSDKLSIKEVCEETESEKVEPERAELSDSSSIKLNEKAVAILNEDEVQGKEQDQVRDDVTCSQDATSIEELQGKHREEIGKAHESDMIRESLELDSEEMKSSVETNLETEYQGLLHDGITTDVCVSTQTEPEKVSSKNEEKAIDMNVCEETSPDNAEPEGTLELSDNMPPGKKEALSVLEKDQGDSEGVINSKDASIGTDFEEQDQNEKPREFLKEDTEDKSVDAQKANEQYENGENDKIEENPEKSVEHNNLEKEQDVHKLEEDQGEDDVTSAQDLSIEGGLQEKNFQSEANNHETVNAKKSIEEATEEIRSTVETPDSSEQQTLINTNATDVCISTQTEPEETTKNEEKKDEEAIGSEDGSPVIKKLNEEAVSEKAESKDVLKPSESTGIVLNDIETVSKDEDQEKEQDLYVSERGQSGGDDVTSSENASNEDIKETTIGEHVTTVACFEEGQALSATPKEIIKEETEDKSIDAQEATKQCDDGTKDDVKQKEEESVNEIEHSSSKIEQAEYTEEIKPSVETNEEKDVCISAKIESQEQATKNEEKAIEIDVARKEKSDNLLVKKVCEEIDLTMSESTEDINLSDSSYVEIEKTLTSLKDVDREKDQEVSISTEDQDKDNDTSSQHVVSKEEGQPEQKDGFVKTRESIDEDTEETKSSDETKENVITTDVCSTTKTEPIEATTGREEKNEEEATENDEGGQTKKPETPLFKDVCEVTSSEQTDSEVQGGGDEVISSHNASNEETKETTSGHHATTVAYFEEGLGVSALTKEILKEEADKPIDAQEEVKQCENEAMDKTEDKHEESVNEPVNSLTVEGGINEDEADAGNKEKEVKLDAESQTHRIEDISEMKDEVVSKEKMSLELGQPKEQYVEEIQAYQLNTVSENSEDGIKKEDGNLSHESVGDTNDNTSKEDKYTLAHELVEEQHSGMDEVLKEKNINLNEATIEPQEYIMPSSSSGVPTEDTSNSEKEKAESEILPIEDLKTVSEVQISEVVTKSEDSNLKEESLITETATYVDEEKGTLTKEISSDEKAEQTKEIKQETVKEECEGTSSEKAEFEEGLELSDSSNMQINEKSITSFKDDDQEKEHEVNLSGEGQDKDDVLSSQNKVSEEDDTKEIKPSVGTNENTEQKGLLHVVTTDDCSSTHTEHEETKEKEEENDEEAIENGEVEDKSIDTLEAFRQHEDESKDKREQKPEEHANSCSETVEGNIQKDETDAGNNTEIEAKLNAENQADIGEDGSEMKDGAISTEKMSMELGQPKALSVEEIQACLTENKSEKTEDDITEKDEDISHDNSIKEEKCFQDGRTREIEISTLEHEPVEEQTGGPDEVSKENFTNLNEATEEAQEDIKQSSSLGTSTEDVEFVSEVQNLEVMPMSEDSKLKEECLISATTTYVDEKETTTEEIPSDENLEPYGSTQKSENLKSTTEENVTQLEKTCEINSVYEKRKMEEDVTQENQTNSEEICSEMVKDVILTEEVPLEIEKENGINDYEEQVVEEDNYSTELQKISAQNQKEMAPEMSYSDPIPAGNPDATEAKVEDKEDISCESKVKKDGVDEEPKEERIISPEDSATIKPQVDLSNIDSTPHLSESEKLATQVLESVGDVQTPEAVADSADTKMKEECSALAKEEHMDESNVEEEPKIKTYETLIASDTEQENVKQELKGDDLKKALTKEDLELHGELKLSSELMLEEDQATETEPQPEQSDITSKNMSDQILESKLEHTSEKHLEDERRDTELNVTITPESQIKSIDNQNETTKNVILTDEVVVETSIESGKSEIIGQISEEDNCPTELDNTSVPDQKELANKIEYSKLISAGNSETTKEKAESQIELENIQAAEDLSYLSKAFSAEYKKEAPILEFEKKERDEELISEVQTPESILKMEMKQEHPETTKDTCETLISGESSEKKLVSMAPQEEVTSLTAEDKTNELVLETDNTKTEQSSISNRDWNPEFLEEEFSKTSSEGEKGVIERYIEEAGQGNFGVESKEIKSRNEVVEDVNANEVRLEVEKATESKSIKENINEEVSCIHNQSPLATHEACQIQRLNSGPNELLETKDAVEGKADMILMAENLNVKDEAVTVIKEPNEDMKHKFENMMTDEEITKTDATEEKETLEEQQTNDPVKTVSDSISSYAEQDVQVGSDNRRGHGDMHKLEENSIEDFEITSEETEIVPEGKEASTNLTDDLPEASPKILLAEQDQEIATATEKIEDKINDKGATVVNMDSSTNTKDVACLSRKKNGEIQVSSLNSEIDEGKKNGSGDMTNIEREVVEPQEHVSKIKFVDPPSDVEIREQEIMHYGSQEPSEDKTLLSQNDKKTEDSVILQSVEKDIIQGVDKRFDEASVRDVKKHEKDFDYEGTSTEAAIPIEAVKKPDVELKPVMDATADKAEKEVLKEDMHFESTCDGSKTTEEVSGMKQEKLEIDSPVSYGTVVKENLEISQKNATDDLVIISHVQPEIQKYGVSDCTVDEQSPNKPHQNESTESKLLAGEIDASHEKGETTAKSLIAEPEDLKSANTSSSELLKEDTKTNNEKERFETTEPAQISFADVTHEPTKGNSEVAENLIGERETAVAKYQQVDKKEIGDSEVKTDEENEDDEEDNEDNQKMGSCSDAPVMVEASKDMEPKVHKKSHNILSGVGSKVKHSIAKVKKAITGKSSNSKPPSPKEKDQEFA